MLTLLVAGCMVLGWGSRSRQAAVRGGVDAQSVLSASNSNTQPATPVLPQAAAKLQARSLMAGLPLMFEPNQGQGNLNPADPRARFVARGSGYSLLLGNQGAILNLSTRSASAQRASRIESLQMKLAGANANATVSGADLLPGKSNYLLGNDPAKWKRGIPQFARVRYENVYPGVNLVFYGNQGRVEYDFQVAPGADPNRAELEFDGAKKLAVKDGSLIVTGENGSVRFDTPKVYQEIAGRQQPVEGSFVLRGAHRAGFSIGVYDHSRDLVIDPILVFSTYFGGSGDELNNYVAVDNAFNIYLAGSTNSPNLPASTTCQYPGCGTLNGTRNVFIAKIAPPQGSSAPALLYVTYLGGNGTDTPVGLGVDGAQNPYVAGTTTSTNFPVTLTAYQSAPTSSGNPHIFVTKLQSTAATLAYSSYLSGSGDDVASGMTIDQQGYLYVTGTTTSTNSQDYASSVNWPVISINYGQTYQQLPKAAPGVVQFFVSKINTAAGGNSSIAYSTYFGGGTFYSTPDPVATGGGIAVDSNSNIYFTGTTNFVYLGQNGTSLVDFPIVNAYQPCLDATPTTVIINPPTCTTPTSTTNPDAFVAKLNPNAPQGSAQLVWSTYLGGANNDSGTGIALDTGALSVFVTGTTNSSDIGSSILLSTSTSAFQRCLNTPPGILMVGQPCPTPTAFTDAYVAKFTNLAASNTTTSNLQLTYFSFLGGSGNENGLALAVNASDGAVLTGSTQSIDFPQQGTQDIQGASGGGQDAFIATINTNATSQNLLGSWSGYFGGSGSDEGTSVALDANQNVYFAGDTNSTNLQVKNPIQASNAGGYDAFVTELGTASTLTVSGNLMVGTNQTYISAGSPATFQYTITNTGSDTANAVVLTDNLSSVGLSISNPSATASSGTCSGGSTSTDLVCNIPALGAGQTATVTIVFTPLSTSTGQAQTFTGGTVTVSSSNNIGTAQTSVAAQMSDFTLSVSPSSATVPTAGDPATYYIHLTPQPVFTTNVQLNCANLPAASNCQFSPTSATLTAGPLSPVLVISTTARPIVTPASLLLTHNFYAMVVIVPILAWLALGSGDRRRRRIAGMLLLCAVFVSLMMLPACSHTTTQPPVSGTPAGSYTVTISATAGSDTKSTSVQLIVP